MTIIGVGGTAGYVGINNTRPAYQLDVTGDINATAFRVGGTAGASGTFTSVTVVNGIVTGGT